MKPRRWFRYFLYPAIAAVWSVGCAAVILCLGPGFDAVGVGAIWTFGNLAVVIVGPLYAIDCRLQDSAFRVVLAIGLVVLSVILAETLMGAIFHLYFGPSEYG